MDLKEKALAMHKEWNGKLETSTPERSLQLHTHRALPNHVKSLQKIKKQPTLIP